MNQKNVLDSVIGEITQLENYINGWKDSGVLPAIEKDLVLQKLQQIYDQVKQLSIVRPQAESAPVPSEAVAFAEPEITVPGPVEEIIFEKTSTIIEERPSFSEIPLKTEHLKPVTEEIPLKSESVQEMTVEEIFKTETVKQAEVQIPLRNEPVKQVIEIVTHKHVESGKLKETSKEILAEKLTHPQKVINETVKAHVAINVSSKLKSAPIVSIQSAINLNDKFVFIRELFKNNSLLYNQTIERLNTAPSYEAAMTIVEKEFAWDQNDALVMKLVELVKRKHNA